MSVSTVTTRSCTAKRRDHGCMIFKLNMLTPSRRLSTHARPRMGMMMRASRGQHAPEPSSLVASTASTRWSGARATCEPWLIKAAERTRSCRESVSSGQPRVERTRVETTRSRARTSKSDNITRTKLRWAARPTAGTARRRRACLTHKTACLKGLRKRTL